MGGICEPKCCAHLSCIIKFQKTSEAKDCKMSSKWVKAFLVRFKARFSDIESRRATILLGIQISLLLLLAVTAVLVLTMDMGGRRNLYPALVIGLWTLMAVSLQFNLSGKYLISAWLMTIVVQLGPWGSILLDNAVLNGDFVPLIFLTLSIQLCAILLSEIATLIIALVQLCLLALLISSSPGLMAQNWLSLAAFMLFTAVLGVVSSFLVRKQMEQLETHEIELQNDKVLLRALSQRDYLTGLYNRRYMQDTLEMEIERAVRHKHSLGIIMTDIDNFKKINDTFGHALGDSVLCEVAEILGSGIRKSDAACRYGGDEFVLILQDCSLTQTEERVDTLRESIKKGVFRYGDVDVGRVNLSFGIASAPENGLSCDEILKFADDALYCAKEESRKNANKR